LKLCEAWDRLELMKKSIGLLLGFFALTAQVQAGLLFNYSQLALRDLDQMSKLVRNKISEARTSGGDQVVPLKEALQAVLARPNEDFMTDKIMPPLVAELQQRNAWESSVQSLVKEALGALKNPKAFKPVVQVTYLVFLENLMSELKPRIGEKFESEIIKQIRDAHIQVTDAASQERRLRVMKETTSPSDIAAALLVEQQAKSKESPKS